MVDENGTGVEAEAKTGVKAWVMAHKWYVGAGVLVVIVLLALAGGGTVE